MVSSVKVAAVFVAAGVLGACTQTTSIRQVLDPTIVADTDTGPQPDAQSTSGVAVQKDGERIFLVPQGSAVQQQEPAPAE